MFATELKRHLELMKMAIQKGRKKSFTPNRVVFKGGVAYMQSETMRVEVELALPWPVDMYVDFDSIYTIAQATNGALGFEGVQGQGSKHVAVDGLGFSAVMPNYIGEELPKAGELKKLIVKKKFDAAEFFKAVKMLEHSATDDAHYVLSCVNFRFGEGGVDAATTDGSRLGLYHFGEPVSKTESEVTVPASILKSIAAKIKKPQPELVMSFDSDNNVCVQSGKYSFYFKGRNDQYPKYKQLIPVLSDDTRYHFSIKTTELVDAVSRVGRFSNHRTFVTKFDFLDDGLRIHAKNPDLNLSGALEIPFQTLRGDFEEPLRPAFNYKYVLDVLKQFKGAETVEVFSQGPLHPTVFRSPGNPYQSLIMPVQIK